MVENICLEVREICIRISEFQRAHNKDTYFFTSCSLIMESSSTLRGLTLSHSVNIKWPNLISSVVSTVSTLFNKYPETYSFE